MKASNRFHIGTGVSSLIMILVVLCLTVFAVLSYTTARADAALTQKSLDAADAYYRAASRMERTLAQVDGVLAAAAEQAGDSQTAYLAGAKEALLKLDGAKAEQAGEGLTLILQQDLGDGRTLRAVLDIPPAGDARYRIESYKLLPVQNWNPDSDVQVWPGE